PLRRLALRSLAISWARLRILFCRHVRISLLRFLHLASRPIATPNRTGQLPRVRTDLKAIAGSFSEWRPRSERLPEFALLVPVPLLGNGLDLCQADRLAAVTNRRQKKNLLLDVGS